MLAKELMEKHSLTQKEAAKRLGLTQAAVSQYKRQLRGYNIKALQKEPKIMVELQKMASKIAESPISAIDLHVELCRLCGLIRSKSVLCAMHNELSEGFENCKICLH
jgi:predicted transcriptional regulator